MKTYFEASKEGNYDENLLGGRLVVFEKKGQKILKREKIEDMIIMICRFARGG